MSQKAGSLALACLAAALALATPGGCRRAQPAFSREQAIARARSEAGMSAPELGIREARIERVTAGLIDLAEARRWMGGDSAGASAEPAVWWVSVQGYFRYEGMPAPGGYPVYVASERYFVYNARTGEALGGGVRGSRPAEEADAVAIYAAVVRHLVAEQQGPLVGKWPVVYIRPRLKTDARAGLAPLDGEPLPAELLGALRGVAPRIEYADLDAALTRDHTRTRNGAILITLHPVRFGADGTAAVGAEYFLGSLGAAGFEYRLRREGAEWRVVERTMGWIA